MSDVRKFIWESVSEARFQGYNFGRALQLSFIAPAPFRIDPFNCSGLPTMTEPTEGVSLRDLQEKIRVMYFDKDAARGVEGTFMWLMEEVGELSSALRGNDRENLAEEFADVLAWLATIANVAGVDLSSAVAAKYGGGCPGCKRLVCTCPDDEKP